ncbi:MAG TPA: hypothetical protein VGM06_23845 [Polyangiaceae bacterium]
MRYRSRVIAVGLLGAMAACSASSGDSSSPGGAGSTSGSSSGTPPSSSGTDAGTSTPAGSGSDAGTGSGSSSGVDGSAPSGPVENSGASCPAVTEPAFGALAAVASLPDPFLSVSAARIANKSDWTCRRSEVAAQMQSWELGHKTPAASTVTGSVSGGSIVVNVSSGGKSISFTSTVTLPTTGKPPYPAMIGVGGVFLDTAALAQQGVAVITFPNDDLAAENDSTSRGQGKFFTLFGADAGAGATIAWAWGVSRLIDFIEANPSAQIDPARLGVTGCSRDGKGALVAGAFDERIALTIPQESGGGGAAAWRVTDSINTAAGSQVAQPLSEIIGENVWFSTALNQFSGHTTKLPFDHHELEALVAPRALLVIENDIAWLAPQSSFEGSTAAHTVWQALGIPDHMAYSMNGGHAHCSFPAAQQPDVDAYVMKFLVGGGTANTAFIKSTTAYAYDKATWQPWTVPTLQ